MLAQRCGWCPLIAPLTCSVPMTMRHGGAIPRSLAPFTRRRVASLQAPREHVLRDDLLRVGPGDALVQVVLVDVHHLGPATPDLERERIARRDRLGVVDG